MREPGATQVACNDEVDACRVQTAAQREAWRARQEAYEDFKRDREATPLPVPPD